MGAITDLTLWLARMAELITTGSPLRAAFIGWLVGSAICPGYMYLLAVFSERRWPKYREQFRAFMPGNLFLGVVFATSCYLCADYKRTGVRVEMYDSDFWLWVPFALAALLVITLSALDIWGTIHYKEGDTDKFAWAQLLSWTKLWHNIVVYGIYGYLLIRVGVPGLSAAPSWVINGVLWLLGDHTVSLALSLLGNDAIRLVMLACLIKWTLLLREDAQKPRHRTGHVRVNLKQWAAGFVLVMATLGLVTRLL